MTSTTTVDGVKVTITLSNTKDCPWDSRSPHNHYRVRLSKNGKSVSFDYFGSINDYQNNIHPEASDVLYCFASDSFTGLDDFEDFMGNMGYSNYEEARKVWKTCVRFAKAAERLGISRETLEKWMDY